MKKILRKILAISASVFLLTSFVACGEGEDEDDVSGPSNGGKPDTTVPADALEFVVNADSTNSDDTVLFVKYERSAAGANEGIKISDAQLKVWKNGKLVKTIKENELDFTTDSALDGYGETFSNFRSTHEPSDECTDKDDLKEYKLKPSIGVKVKAGDTIKVKLTKGTVTGPGASVVSLDNILIALIDKAEAVGYYKELSETKFIPLGSSSGSSGESTGEEVESWATDAIGDVVTFNVSKAALTKDLNKITLRYLRSAKSAKEKITLKDAVYYVQCNNGKIEKKTGDIKFALNPYGGCFDFGEDYKEGTPVTDAMRTASGKYTGNSLNELEVDANEYNFEIAYNPKQFAVGDVVKFQLVSAKVTGEGAAKINDIKKKIKAILVDGSENAGKESGVSPTGWYEELSDQLADVVYPRVIKDSAVIEAIDAPVVDAGLLEEPTDLDWSAGASVSATSFADVTGNKKIVITYTSNTENDYHKFKMMAGGSELFAGIATGFTIDLTSTGDDLHGCSFTNAPSSVEQTLAYQPHETEWTKIKASGFKLIGHGVKITKIEVADSDVDNPSGEIETPEPETPPASTAPTALSGITIPEGATVLYKASDAANSVFKDADIQTWWDNEGALAFKIEYTKIGDTEGVVKVTSEAGSCGAFALGEGKAVSIPAGQKLVISVYTANGVKFKPVAPNEEFSVTGKADWQLFEVSYTEAAELKQLGIVGNGKSGNSEHYIDAVYLVEDDNAGGNTGSDPVAPPAATADYSAKNLDVTTVTNTYSESSHGIQAKITVRTGDNLKGLAAGDKFTVVMKGTSTKAFVPQVYFMDNTAAGAYTNLGEWGDTINITTDAFEVTKEITLKKAPSSDDADAFMFVIDYDEKGAIADIENATITFSEFTITKKVSE